MNSFKWLVLLGSLVISSCLGDPVDKFKPEAEGRNVNVINMVFFVIECNL
jgi:hypothetical protein